MLQLIFGKDNYIQIELKLKSKSKMKIENNSVEDNNKLIKEQSNSVFNCNDVKISEITGRVYYVLFTEK